MRGKMSHMLSQSYIHPCRMHSPCRAVAEIQLPRTPSSQMSSCFLPTLSVAKGYRFHTEHLLASFLSCFESGPSRTHRESNLCKKAGSVSSLTSGLIVPLLLCLHSLLPLWWLAGSPRLLVQLLMQWLTPQIACKGVCCVIDGVALILCLREHL